MKQTLVIGSAVTDVIINIDHLPHTGEDIHISSQSRSLGGCACIVSDILRHSGAPYSLCTAIGSGLYGSFVEQELKKRGVPIYVRRPDAENGCCYCMVETGGERTFIVDHGIEYTFYETYLKNIDTTSIDSVYVCGLEIEEYTGMNIIAYLEKHPEYTVYFAPGARILQIRPERMKRLFALHPVLHMNEEESLAYTKKSSVQEAARTLWQETQNTVIITLGAKGAYCFDGREDIFAPPVPARVTDTIGAGDSHMGAIIAARRFGLGFADALTAANHISSAVAATQGGLLDTEAFRRAVAIMPEKIQAQFEKT